MQQIIKCLEAMPRCFKGFDLCSVLTNGKVETHLKTLMGITWVAGQREGRRRSFCMDKNLNAPLDLVAFEGGSARFWIEAKCDFAADRISVERSARSALKQIWAYAQELPFELKGCPAYIVHFLCPLPDEEQYPEWVEVFDPLVMNSEYTPKLLSNYYSVHARNHNLPTSGIREMRIDFQPNVGAVVVKFATAQVRDNVP